MKTHLYAIRAKVWVYPGKAGWHFVTLPRKQSEEIGARFGAHKRGWGSLPVSVKVGNTTWDTSIFPDAKSDGYLLPLKADVRKRERIVAGGMVTLSLEIKV